MKKIGLLFATVVMMLLFAFSVSAASESDLTFKLNDDGNSYSVVDCRENAQGELTIPSTYKGKEVTLIDGAAFWRCTRLTSITIPDSVTAIYASAFSDCTELASIVVDTDNKYYSSDSNGVLFNKDKSIIIKYTEGNTKTSYTIPNSVITIGTYAFKNCDKLTSITIPDSVTTIEFSAFYSCGGLIAVTIPDSVTTIGIDAFSECRGLTSITIPDSVMSIADRAFKYCSGLESVVIPYGVTTIGKSAFESCGELTSIIIPGSVTTIGEAAFKSCGELTSITLPFIGASLDGKGNHCLGYLFGGGNYEPNTYVPKNLREVIITVPCKSIGSGAFSDCVGLTNIRIPDSVTSIENSAFSGCAGLTNITIPNSVTSIGDNAFKDCTGFTNITIPSSVSSIGGSVFFGCTELTSITLPFVGSSLYDEGTSRLGYFFGGSYYEGNTYVPEKLREVILTAPCKFIGSSAFSYCVGLTSITIPDSVTAIGAYAFYNTGYYNDLSNWTNRVLYIGNHLIKALDSVTSCNIRKGTKTIADNAFYDTALTSVTIPNSVITIGSYAFSDTSISSVTIPSSVITIGSRAFSSTGLASIIIPNSVTSIGSGTFHDCVGLTSIIIPDTVTSIGSSAFSDCWNLTSITIPRSVTMIDEDTFRNCWSLTSITIPDGVTSIGARAFYNSAVKSIIIPSSLKNISGSAFRQTGIEYVFYEGSELEKKNITIPFEGNERIIFDAVWHYNATGHSYSVKTTKAATCGANGMKSYTCFCGDAYTETIKATGAHKGGTAACTKKAVCTVCKQSYGSLKSHTYATTTTKATLSKDGKVESKCTVCGNVNSSTTINKVKTVKLSSASLAYTGKTVTPSVTVKDSKGKTLKKGTDYTVTYPKKRKSIGKYTVTVTFKGNYSGTKKLTFEIVPAKAALSKLTAGSKQLTATWKTVSGVTGYEVQYSTSKKFTKKTTKTVTIKKAKTKKTTIKKLSKGKKYFVRVRAYKTVSGKKICGTYSAVKNVKVK